MTDRVQGLYVEDIRTDDVEPLILVIRSLRGVLSCEADVVDIADHNARMRVRFELQQKLLDALRSDENT